MSNEIMLNHAGQDFTHEQLCRIGREVASLWGAECYAYEIKKRKKEIVFNCIEWGEKFIASVSFDELAEYLPNY